MEKNTNSDFWSLYGHNICTHARVHTHTLEKDRERAFLGALTFICPN